MSELRKDAQLELEVADKTQVQWTDTIATDSNFANQQLPHDLGKLAIICLGWNICNTWGAAGVTMAIGLPQGGFCMIIYGIILTTVMYTCCVATLAELASVYPTSGGQYHWTSILAPKWCSRVLVSPVLLWIYPVRTVVHTCLNAQNLQSYACGSVSVFAWITIAAGVLILCPQYLLALVIHHQPDYVPQRWHYFLIYQVLYNVSFVASLCMFLVITVVCLARSGAKQSSELVWSTFTNETGWRSKGIVFLTGMINPNYIFAGIDGAIHVAEECSNATVAVPHALLSTLTIGFISAFTFVIAMAYSITSLDEVLTTPTGLPIYQIWIQATKSDAAAFFFVLVALLITYVVVIACQHTASRLTWAFARDNALIFSHSISHIHPSLEVPVWALMANSMVMAILGCIYLGSTTAFNAFIGVGLILQQVSFAFPALLLLLQRRSEKYLKPVRYVRLGALGWICNTVTVAYSLVTLIFYCFPAYLPVTGISMNYSVAVLTALALFSAVNWIFHANKHYRGPRLVTQD